MVARFSESSKTYRQSWVVVAGYVLVSLMTIGSFLLLVSNRAIDNNRLTSWDWVFRVVNPVDIVSMLLIGIIAALITSNINPPKRYHGWLLILLSFVSVIPFWRSPEVIVDSARYFTQAKHLELYGPVYFFKEWGHNIVAWTDLPLLPFIYGLIFKFFGESRVYIQIFTALTFCGTVILTYIIGKTLWDEDTGFYGGLLMLGIPYIFSQVPLMLVDVPTMFFLILAVYLFIRVIELGGLHRSVAASISIFLAVFSKYSTWIMLSVLVVVFAVYLFDEKGLSKRISVRPMLGDNAPRRAVFFRGIAVASLAALFVGIAVFAKYDVIMGQIELLRNYQKPGLRRWGESFYSTFLFQIHPFISLAALLSVFHALIKRDPKYLIVGWLAFLVFATKIERIRYIIMVFPMLCLMASYGLRALKSDELRRFVALCAVMVSLVIAIFAYSPFLNSISVASLKEAGSYLNSAGVEEIEVFALPIEELIELNPAVSVATLDLFFSGDISYRYDITPPPLEKIEKSSLRFTWGYKNPQYYQARNVARSESKAIVVIASSEQEILPEKISRKLEGYRLSKVFRTSTGIFKYRTVVEVYRPGK